MAAKKRTAKKNSGKGNPAAASQRGRSVQRIQAGHAVEALAGEFSAWIAAQVPTFTEQEVAQITELQVSVVGSVMPEYAEFVQDANVRSVDPDAFSTVMADFLVAMPQDLDPEPVFTSMIEYFNFLADKDLWEGTAEDLAEVRELLEETLAGFAADDAAVTELVRGTQLFARVKSFAQNLGEGIDLADMNAEQSTARNQIMEAMGIDPQDTDPDGPAPLEFSYIWNAALMSVVEPGEDALVRDEAAFEDLVEGDGAESADVLSEMVIGAVYAHLVPAMEAGALDEAHYLVLRNLLVTAATGREADFAALRRTVGPKAFETVLPQAQAAMESLVRFGLLEQDGQSFTISERMAPLVSAGISEAEALFAEEE